MSAAGTPDFWERLKTDALNFWQTVDKDIVALWHRAEPVIKHDLAVLWQQLSPIAMNLIVALGTAEFNQLTGGQKASIVDAGILGAAKAQAIAVGQADVAMIRQQAFNALGSTVPAP